MTYFLQPKVGVLIEEKIDSSKGNEKLCLNNSKEGYLKTNSVYVDRAVSWRKACHACTWRGTGYIEWLFEDKALEYHLLNLI